MFNQVRRIESINDLVVQEWQEKKYARPDSNGQLE